MRRRHTDAFHADGAGNGSAVLHHAPRAARQAAELGSHREASAQYERALRFTADADPTMIAGLYDGLGFELMLVGRLQDAIDAGERALGLWRQAGNRVREGGTLCNLTLALQPLGRGPDAVTAAESAVTVLEPLGPTVELARAYAILEGHPLRDRRPHIVRGSAIRAGQPRPVSRQLRSPRPY